MGRLSNVRKLLVNAKERGFTYSSIGRTAGVSGSYVTMIAKGKYRGSDNVQSKIKRAIITLELEFMRNERYRKKVNNAILNKHTKTNCISITEWGFWAVVLTGFAIILIIKFGGLL